MRFTAVLRDFRKVGELTKKYANLPDSYIKRSMEQIWYKSPRKPNFLPREFGRKKIKFTMHRPWTLESKTENPMLGKYGKIFVQPIKNWSIFKGDRVEILMGKDKGKQGIVEQVVQERNWVTVGGLNMKIEILKKQRDIPSVIRREEQPLRVTDEVALIDPSDLLPCEIEWRYTEKGERVRVSMRSGRIIPIPRLAEETYDYKVKKVYEEKAKDTPASVAEKDTFVPKLCTFEMEIMKDMNIEETRTQAPFYWY